MKTFDEKLLSLIMEETKGKFVPTGLPEEKFAEIIEALAAHLGKFIAIQTSGDAKTMGTILDGSSSHMYEVAAEFQAHGQLLAGLASFKKK